MNWEAMAAIGELIGATGVVISLIYLAVQIRLNTRQVANSIEASQLAAFERNVAAGNRMREFFLVNPELLALYVQGSKSYQELDKHDRVRFGMLVRNVFSEIHGAYIRQCTLNTDPLLMQGIAKMVDENVAARGVQEYIRQANPDWRLEFRQFVEERMQLVSQQQAAQTKPEN